MNAAAAEGDGLQHVCSQTQAAVSWRIEPRLFFFIAQKLTCLVLLALLGIGVSCGAVNAQETLSAPDSAASDGLASVEEAVYSAELHDLDLSNGQLSLDVIRRGKGPAILNWSDVKIAIGGLKWEQQPLLAGTTAEQKMVVLVDRDRDRLSGHWSARGRSFNQRRVFDLTFPPALNTRVVIRMPADMKMESSQGVLKADSSEGKEIRDWTLELGNLTSTTLKIGPTQQFESLLPPRYEIETEYRARRDGLFIKSDITLEGPLSSNSPLKLNIPAYVEIQSLTLFSGAVQIGTSLPVQRNADHPQQVTVSLENLHLEPRFTLRLRGFQPATWGETHNLSKFEVAAGTETRRTAILRIEPPLQLQTVESPGMLQTSLTTEETSGEVWRFEAREPSSDLQVVIDLPQSEIVADIHCLADARKGTGWVATVLSMHVENGSRFNTTIQLPEDWKLISVAAGDAESRLSSWTLDQRKLHVTWQNPMTTTSHRQLRLFARPGPWKLQSPQRLHIPQILFPNNSTITYQILVPNGVDLQLADGEGWRISDNIPISPALLRLREVTERISDPFSVVCSTLRSVADSRSGRASVNLVPKELAAEATSPADSPLASPSPEAAENDAAESDQTVPAPAPQAVLDMQLTTMVGPSIQLGCMHQAELRFNHPVPAAALKLKLPASCRLSALEVDGNSVTVFRKGEEIPLPAVMGNVSTLRLTYMTDATAGWLYHTGLIPVPVTSIPVSGFHWTLDLPADQRLARIDLPGLFSGSEQERNAARQYFGPLTRQSSDTMFNPLHKSDWLELLNASGPQEAVQPNRRSLQFIAPTVGENLQFVVWNAAKTRSYAWVALLACLMIGAAARLFRIAWLRQIAILWLSLLFVMAFLAPPAWSFILGGMFSGSLLSVLIPRRWMQSRDFLSPPPQDSVRTQKIVVATLTLMCVTLASGQATTEPSKVAAAVESGAAPGNSLPLYLIESARYEMSRLSPAPRVRAVFQVLTRPQTADIFIRLPLQDVVFTSAADCLVNGKKQTLIPSVTGDAMVVTLSQSDAEIGDRSGPEGWIRSEIQLDFVIRSAAASSTGMGAISQDNAVPAFLAVVPSVLDSTLKLPSQLTMAPVERWGQVIVDDSGTTVLQLGGIGKIAAEAGTVNPQNYSGTTAITVIQVTPMRFRGQTRLVPGPAGWPAALPLTFPPGCVVTSLNGSHIQDMIASPSNQEQSVFTIRLRPGAAPAPITINFELPSSLLTPTELLVPAFPLWTGANITHLLGVTTTATATLALVKSPDVTPFPVEEWPSDADSSRNRPLLAVKLTNPHPVQFIWSKVTAARLASTMEQLQIQRDGINWSASVRLNVTRLPIFRQQFKIDPSVRIESVVVSESGMEGAVRFSRAGNVLSVFIPGGQLGERVFTVSGRIPLSVDAWTAIPAFEPVATMVSDSQLTVIDQTSWNAELESAPGVPIAVPAVVESATPAVGKGRSLGIYRREADAVPQRFRITMPVDATRADSVTHLRTPSNEQWEAISTFHLTAVDSTLKKAVFHIPQELTGIRIRPSNYQYTTTADSSGTTVNVKIPDRFSSTATITISARVSDSVKEQFTGKVENDRGRQSFPMIQVLSAQKTSQFALVDPKTLFVPAPTGSLRIDAAAFPSWAPADWVRGVRDSSLVCYQLIRKDLSLVRKSVSEASGQPIVRLDETILWPLAGDQTRGLSRIWLASKGGSPLLVRHDKDVSIQSVLTPENGMLDWTSTAQGTEVNLPEKTSISGILIHWTRTGADHRLNLLDFESDPPPRRLVAVTRPDQWDLDLGNGKHVDVLQIWLDRWDALLKCVHDLSGPVPVDSILLGNIRLCQHESATLLEHLGQSAAPALQEEFNRLSKDWNSIKDDLVISGDKVSQPQAPLASAFADILLQPRPGLRVEWVIPPPTDWTGSLKHQPEQAKSWLLICSAAGLLLAALCVFRFSTVLTRIRNLLARHPSWSFMLLGLIWWIWLSPSSVGLLLIVLAWTWSGLRWLVAQLRMLMRQRAVRST